MSNWLRLMLALFSERVASILGGPLKDGRRPTALYRKGATLNASRAQQADRRPEAGMRFNKTRRAAGESRRPAVERLGPARYCTL